MDWPQARGDASFSGHLATTIPDPLRFVWAVNSIVGAPVVAAGLIYQCQPEVTEGIGMVMARHVSDGSIAWSVPVPLLTTEQPAVGDGLVYVAVSDPTKGESHFLAFDSVSGALAFTLTPTLAAGVLMPRGHTISLALPGYVAFEEGHSILDTQPPYLRESPGMFYLYKTPEMTPAGYGSASPRQNTRAVRQGNSLHYFQSLDPWPPFQVHEDWTGCRCTFPFWPSWQRIWEEKDKGNLVLAGESATLFDPTGFFLLLRCGVYCEPREYAGPDTLYGSPIVGSQRNLLCVTREGTRLAARDPASPGRTLSWVSGDLGYIGRNDVAVGGDKVIVLSERGRRMTVISDTTGLASLSVDVLSATNMSTTGVTLTSNAVLFGDLHGLLHVIDPVSGQERQVLSASSGNLIGDIVVAGATLFTCGADGVLCRLGATGYECGARSSGYPQNGHQSLGPGGVNTLSGNLVFTVQDAAVPFAGISFSFVRTYNSDQTLSASVFSASGTVTNGGKSVAGTPFESSLGPGWTHNFQISVRPQFDKSSGATLYVRNDWDGRQVGYTCTLTGEVTGPPGVSDALFFTQTESVTSTVTGRGVLLTTKYGVARDFDLDGYMRSVRDPMGNRLVYTYTPTAVFKPGAGGARLVSVVYQSSTLLASGGLVPAESATVITVATFVYNSDGRLWKMRCLGSDGVTMLETAYGYTTSGPPGLLSDVTGPGGIYHSQYAYNSGGQMRLKHEPRAPAGLKNLAFEYDFHGRVRAVMTPGNSDIIATYRYIPLWNGGRQVFVDEPTAAGPAMTTFFYDDCETLVRVQDAMGGSSWSGWDNQFNNTSRTDAQGHTATMDYDAKGNLTKAVDPMGGQSLYQYELRFSSPTRYVDANGNETKWRYDGFGNRTSDVRTFLPLLPGDVGAQYVDRTTYDVRGLPVSATTAAGSETFHRYDSLGNLIETTQRAHSPSGTTTDYVTSYGYDALGRRISMVDPRGFRTEWVYDLEGQLKQLRSGIAPGATALDVVTYEYDDLNRRTRETDAAGRYLLYTYTDRDQEESVTDALGHVTANTYDLHGNRLTTTDPNGHTTTFTYNQLNRLIRVTDAMMGSVSYGYDLAGNMTSMVDPGNNLTTYGYDDANRRISLNYPDGSYEAYGYDYVGNLTNRQAVKDAQRLAVTQTFDSLNRLRVVTYTDDTPTVSSWYDPAGNRTKAETTVLGNPYVVASQYDTLNRVVEEAVSAGGSPLATKRMAYDASGNRVMLEADAAGGAGTELSMVSVFDPLSRATAVTAGGRTTMYAYDTACLCGSKSNPVSITYPNGVETRMKYDAANRLLSVRHLRGPVALGFHEYGYDNAGNRTSMRDLLGLHSYGYDSLSRLVSVDHPSWPDQGYGYDAAGNRLTLTETGTPVRSYNYNALNELAGVAQGTQQTDYAYDFRGNLASRTVKGTPDQVTTYTFDGANRLGKVEGPSGAISYGYDSSGQRVCEAGPNGVVWYVYDGLSAILELGSDRKARSAIVPGISRTRLDLTEPLTEWYLHDGLGSVVMLTDVLGNPTQEYLYDVFGTVRNVVRDPFNRYQFVGLAHDDVTGLIYMNARWYDSVVGRFLSRDPVEGDATTTQGRNPYAYAFGNPIGLSDRSGRKVQRCTRKSRTSKPIVQHTVVQFLGSETGCNNLAYGLVPAESGQPVTELITCVTGAVPAEAALDPKKDPDVSCTEEPNVNEKCACKLLKRYQAEPPDYCLGTYDCRDFAADVIGACTGASDEPPPESGEKAETSAAAAFTDRPLSW